MKLTIMNTFLFSYIQSKAFQLKAFRWQQKIYTPFKIILPFLVFMYGLAGCSTLHSSSAPTLKCSPTPNVKASSSITEHCVTSKTNDATEDWMQTLMLDPTERKKTLRIIETPNNKQEIWLRVFLLTHGEASYHDLQEAKQLLQNKLNSNAVNSNTIDKNTIDTKILDIQEYGSEALHAYMLKLNLYFQEKKSETVILERQLNTRDRTIKTLQLVNEVLENKIKALTNIEQRMKLHPNKIGLELTP
jgi:hypothetical protein